MRSKRRFIATGLGAVLIAFTASSASACPVFTFNPSYFFPPRPPKPVRVPKSGEHLGEHLLAERMPARVAIPDILPPLPQTVTPLPAYNELREFELGFGYKRRGESITPPKLGDLPPESGAYLGEYAAAYDPHWRYLLAELKPARQDVGISQSAMARVAFLTVRATSVSVFEPLPDSGGWQTPVSDSPAPSILPQRVSSGNFGDNKCPFSKSDDRTAIRFTGPGEPKITVQSPDGTFGDEARKEHNFKQGNVYRLQVSGAAKRVFYPTVEVTAAMPKTRVYLQHAAVPVVFTAAEFAEAEKGTLVVKVVYLPDPNASDFSVITSAEEVVSTRLEPGTDPVAEAQRRGTILAVVRLGNIDLENREPPTPKKQNGPTFPREQSGPRSSER